MVQKFDYPKSESELRITLDRLYEYSKRCTEEGNSPAFKRLLEIVASEVNILTAIHNIKSNKGSKTQGSNGETMRTNILEKDYTEIIERVKTLLKRYKPKPVRRVHIPKRGKKELRSLRIPAIADRIVQECIRIVLEPIVEAQFFEHSYGFRPMREPRMAIQRVSNIVHSTGYHWIVEGDISKFFDNVNHTILLKKLWNMGIRDKRILMVIKEMLKAGIMEEVRINSIGTPQGGIISPLLANVYLNSLDQWVTREWENKKTRHFYEKKDGRIGILRRNSNLKPVYFVRYANDWLVITNSRKNAEAWKKRISYYLKEKLKLELSEEKTLITNISKKPIKFLGIHLKFKADKARKGYIPTSRPDPERLKGKVAEIRKAIKNLRKIKASDKEEYIHIINVINSKIRGVVEYYQICINVNSELAKYSFNLRRTAFNVLNSKLGADWIPAKEVDNLITIHSQYTTAILTIEYRGVKIGVTILAFSKWSSPTFKNQEETPYTSKGGELYHKRTGKSRKIARADELLSLHLSKRIAAGQTGRLYNFEYFLNRSYAFNRDKGRCRVCRGEVEIHDLHIHHIEPQLPLEFVNRVPNLATVHENCHRLIHGNEKHEYLDKKVWNKILKFREFL